MAILENLFAKNFKMIKPCGNITVLVSKRARDVLADSWSNSSDLEEGDHATYSRSVPRASKCCRSTSKGEAEEDMPLTRGDIPHIVAAVLRSMKHGDPPESKDPQLPGTVML